METPEPTPLPFHLVFRDCPGVWWFEETTIALAPTLEDELRVVWKQVPAPVRETLVRCWGQHQGGTEFGESPRCEVLNRYSEPRTVAATTIRNGHLMRVFAPIYHRLPSELQKVVLGHELAHCFIHASPEEARTFFSELGTSQVSSWEECILSDMPELGLCGWAQGRFFVQEAHLFDWMENRARKINESWGFQESLIDQWGKPSLNSLKENGCL